MIKVFLCDLDGVLTDGCYYRFEQRQGDQEIFGKKFNTRDWHGLMKLSEMGVELGVITSSRSSIISQQIRNLSFAVTLRKGIVDKKQEVEKFYISRGINWSEIAYVGDDDNDIPLLKAVGIAACPADAEREVLSMVSNRLDERMFMFRYIIHTILYLNRSLINCPDVIGKFSHTSIPTITT